MAGTAGNRGFVRTQVSTTERVISLGLVIGLGALGMIIYQSGQHFDESLFGLDPAALAAPTTGPNAGPTPANTILMAPRSGAAVAATGPVAWLEQTRPDSWERLGEIESFDAADLYVIECKCMSACVFKQPGKTWSIGDIQEAAMAVIQKAKAAGFWPRPGNKEFPGSPERLLHKDLRIELLRTAGIEDPEVKADLS